MVVPTVAKEKAAAHVETVEVDTPTYLEVPDFQRVATIGDYAAGVLFVSHCGSADAVYFILRIFYYFTY